MNLSQTAEYALRAMAHLALDEAAAVRARDLAEASGIPVHYVSKLLRRLVVAGLLDSRKGHGGGFALAKEPLEISFLDILRAVDYRIERDRCAYGWGTCKEEDPCPLHASWSRLSDAVYDWARHTTLKDIQEGGPGLIPRAIEP
jgi:Rrf2 family transcriptional regulator, iron-sulfur cluster assembly transcription factor